MANHQLRRFLFGLIEQFNNLFRFKPVKAVVVDRQDFIARHHTSFGRWRVGQGLQDEHAAGQDGNDGTETLADRCFHLFQLFELVSGEEDRVGIQMADQAGDRALIERLIGIGGICGVVFNDAPSLDEPLHGSFVGSDLVGSLHTTRQREKRQNPRFHG